LVSTNSLVLSKNKTGIIKCWRRFAILIAEMDQNIFHIMRTPAAPPSTSVATPSPQSGATSVVSPAASPPEFVTPFENDEERLDAANGELHVRYRAYDNIIGAGGARVGTGNAQPHQGAEFDEYGGAVHLR
jgi:hypothetical protein